MRRLSPRRLFLFLACAVSCVLLFVNIEQRVLGTGLSSSTPSDLTIAEDGLSRRLAEEAIAQVPQYPAEPVHSRETSGKTDGAETEPVPPPTSSIPLSLDRRLPLDPSDVQIPDDQAKAWYMKGGQLTPKKDSEHLLVWPEEAFNQDRIPEQLMYVPDTVPEHQEDSTTPLKKILLWNGVSSWGGLVPGRGVFLKEVCPVSSCVLTTNRAEAEQADLILFKDHYSPPSVPRPSHQIWMLYLLECPLHTQVFGEKHIFNWTATYRTDSTVVAPYERWQYYNENVKRLDQRINYAANKTKKVAWFVSNCGARNNRLQYARELANHIEVDIYGACGSKRCPRTEQGKCFNMLNTDYKFYLAFENSNCKDYITEKFFVNGLGHDVLPIAMGARYEDYKRSAPEHSFIHVDQFASPKELAAYLHILDKDDKKYNEYFQWKGTGEFINTKFFCRVCTMLHDAQRRQEEYRSIEDVNNWWRGEGTCINGSWNTAGSGKEEKEETVDQSNEKENKEEETEKAEAKEGEKRMGSIVLNN